MSEKQAEYNVNQGFVSPNYTQTPNDFFLMLPEMGDAELRVTLVMIRKTFGFHRDGFKMGIKKLADAAGLSRQGALTGAEQAEMRGTFKRINPDDQGEAEWELVVPLYQEEAPLQPVEGAPPAGGGQVGVKERIKKESKDIGASAPLDWKLGHNQEVTQHDLEAVKEMEYKNAADLIATGLGVLSVPAYDLALTFMQTRKIVIAESKVKGQRKAVKDMLSRHVTPKNVYDAVNKLLADGMTVTDLFSVIETADHFANQPNTKPKDIVSDRAARMLNL